MKSASAPHSAWNGLRVLPTPKSITRRRGWLKLPEAISAAGNAVSLRMLKFLRDLPVKEVSECMVGESVPYTLLLSKPGMASRVCVSKPPRDEEGYALIAGPSWISISARSEQGLFYGIMTLNQIFRNHSQIPCCEIADWPDMPVRGIHLDLKGCTPTVEYVKSLIPQLAQYKINTLLMEYEDALQLDCLPGISKPSAWSKSDVEAIAAVARENYVNLLPLVQGLGHVQYVLRHNEFASYRETPDGIQQYCPTYPATLPFVMRQVDEISEVFPESVYFHIGMDETRQLGQCPRCKRQIGRNGNPLDVYLDYLGKLCSHVKGRGYIPVFWDDMISRSEAGSRLKKLPAGAAVMVWLYNMSKESLIVDVDHTWYGQRELFDHDYLQGQRWHPIRHSKWLDDMSAESKAKYVMPIKGTPFLNSNPYLELLSAQGTEVFGAAAAKSSIENNFLPDLALRLDNIIAWGSKIAATKQTGVVSTAWSRRNSLAYPGQPIDAMWYTMCASAQFYWSATGASVKQFQTVFDREFFGVDDDGFIAQTLEAVTSVASNAALAELNRKTVSRNEAVWRTHQLLGQLSISMKRALTSLPRHLFSLYPKNHPYAEQANSFAASIAQELTTMRQLQPEAETYYRSVMLPEDAQEMIDSHFGSLDRLMLGLE